MITGKMFSVVTPILPFCIVSMFLIYCCRLKCLFLTFLESNNEIIPLQTLIENGYLNIHEIDLNKPLSQAITLAKMHISDEKQRKKEEQIRIENELKRQKELETLKQKEKSAISGPGTSVNQILLLFELPEGSILAQLGTFPCGGCRDFTESLLSVTLNKSLC